MPLSTAYLEFCLDSFWGFQQRKPKLYGEISDVYRYVLKLNAKPKGAALVTGGYTIIFQYG